MDSVRKVNMLVSRAASGPGSARGSESNSLSSIISTLVPVLIVAGVMTGAFMLLRTKYQRVYEPRSMDNLVPQHDRAERAKGTKFGWATAMKDIPDADILKRHSMDGYLYLRYFKMMAFMSVVGVAITWPVLFPVNATGGAGQQQLDILSFSNVLNANRYYAHALIAWLFQGFVVWLIIHERKFFIGLRQAYFMSPRHALRLSSRTVMFLSLPTEQMTSAQMKEVFPHARKIWMAPDCEELQELIDTRDQEWQRVEKAEVTLMQNIRKKASKSEGNFNAQKPFEGVEFPTHRLKFLIGKKVDTIQHSRSEMARLDGVIEKSQNRLIDEKGTLVPAAFVEFHNQLEAQKALQFAAKDKRTTYNPRQIGVQPDEVIWKNLSVSYASRKSKMTIASIIMSLIILFWAIPVAFVGILTNVNALIEQVPFLSFIRDIPPVILGVVTGLLPTILLAVLTALVPILCRLLAKFAGAATLTEVELKTQTWYFAFQVVQVFLITTLTSAATSVAAKIVTDPTSAVTLLATNLPKASNFYISYIILIGLVTFGSLLINIVPLALLFVFGFLDKTPRQKYNRWMTLKGLSWGSIYPKFTLLGVISITYSCIAPLILGFSAIGFALLYLGFRYNILFVSGVQVDMKGEAYARAMKQIMTGVYLSTICLIGLFAIKTGSTVDAVGPLVLMIIFLVALVIVNVAVDRALAPLEQFVPLSRLEANIHSSKTADQVEQLQEKNLSVSDSPTKAVIDRNSSQDDTTTASNAEPKYAAKDPTDNFLTRWAMPQIDKSFESNKALLDSWSAGSDHHELYTAEDVDEAYQNPALSATTRPIIWIPRDNLGVSKRLVTENREAGVESTDECAWLMGKGKGKVEWSSDRLQEVPIYEEKKLW